MALLEGEADIGGTAQCTGRLSWRMEASSSGEISPQPVLRGAVRSFINAPIEAKELSPKILLGSYADNTDGLMGFPRIAQSVDPRTSVPSADMRGQNSLMFAIKNATARRERCL
jgi:hypothetical protein